jgi:hypothetical protein
MCETVVILRNTSAPTPPSLPPSLPRTPKTSRSNTARRRQSPRATHAPYNRWWDDGKSLVMSCKTREEGGREGGREGEVRTGSGIIGD